MHRKTPKRHRVGSKLAMVILTVTGTWVGSNAVLAQAPATDALEPEKLQVLRSFEALSEQGQPSVPGDRPFQLVRPWPLDEFELPAARSGASARRITGDTLQFEGTGYFALKVRISRPVSVSMIGYIVESLDDREQNMVIMEDLRQIGTGMRTIVAACADLRKSFPSSGAPMAATPWTDDSPNHWAYWVRQAAERGLGGGYSFDEIQSNIWYITDRAGTYAEMRLLQSLGYRENGPSKNVTPTLEPPPVRETEPQPTDPCGSLCGDGFPFFFPVLFGAMITARIAQGRARLRGNVIRS